MQKYLFKDIFIVNEGKIACSDVLVINERIEKVSPNINVKGNVVEIIGENKHLFPGLIDDGSRWGYELYGNAQHYTQCIKLAIIAK
jgi:dihydroorotase-like cyclic amidohydrolase